MNSRSEWSGFVQSKDGLIRIPGESIGLKFIPSQSELFRFIPISVSESMRIIPNKSEKRVVSRLMKNGQKSIRLIPRHRFEWIRTNPKRSFQSRSIRINAGSFWLGSLAKVSDWNSFRVNQNYSDSFRYLYPSLCESFQTNPKKRFMFRLMKNGQKSIRLIPRHRFEWIRNQVFNPD